MAALRPGDVVVVSLHGAVSTKPRPVVVLSSETYHQERPDVIVGLITTNTVAATASTDYILLDWVAAGLRQPSAFRAYLSTEREHDISKTIGRLTDRDWAAVQERVRRALALR